MDRSKGLDRWRALRVGGGGAVVRDWAFLCIVLRSSGGFGGMNTFNAGVAGESSLIEGEDGREAMHVHGGHQPGIVRWLPRNPILNDKILPNWINRHRSQGWLPHRIVSAHEEGGCWQAKLPAPHSIQRHAEQQNRSKHLGELRSSSHRLNLRYLRAPGLTHPSPLFSEIPSESFARCSSAPTGPCNAATEPGRTGP